MSFTPPIFSEIFIVFTLCNLVLLLQFVFFYFPDCPEGPDVLLIVLAVIGGIVGIGIILLILWKLLTAMVVRKIILFGTEMYDRGYIVQVQNKCFCASTGST
jgi:hypothetical protein